MSVGLSRLRGLVAGAVLGGAAPIILVAMGPRFCVRRGVTATTKATTRAWR